MGYVVHVPQGPLGAPRRAASLNPKQYVVSEPCCCILRYSAIEVSIRGHPRPYTISR